jgi:glyoxylase-like metal-dependent hydrolase (beta-lactamase superfamily II)
MHTFLAQRDRSAEDDEDFVAPTTLVGDGFTMDWGRHSLAVFHNPGKTLCTLCVDVPGSDLLFSSDNLVGNTVYLSSGAPEVIDGGLERLERLRRGRVVPGHIGVLPGAAVRNARHYLRQLRRRVKDARRGLAAPEAIRRIAIEECVAPSVTPIPFEREWHARNLDVILDRRLFTVDAFERGLR